MTARELSGTTAIVTGASKGFGRATAIALAGRGAHVVGVARSADLLDELRDQLGDSIHPRGRGRHRSDSARTAALRVPARDADPERRRSPGRRAPSRADLGDVQHQLACGRPAGLQLRESQSSRSARTGFGGGHDLERRGIAWLAASAAVTPVPRRR